MTAEDKVEAKVESEAEAERDTVPPLKKQQAALSTPARTEGYDFSSYF